MGTANRKVLPATTGPNGLTPKQEAAAVALAGGATQDEAAKQSGAGVTTIKDWLSLQPAFARRVTELRAELSGRVLGRIAKGMCTAVDTLERLCVRGKTEATQLRAAEAMLTHGTALGEVADLKARLAALETGGNR